MKSEEKQEINKPWKPTYKWMGVTAGIILAFLIISFFVLNIVLKPYMREIPMDVTPWLAEKKIEREIPAPKTGEINNNAQ